MIEILPNWHPIFVHFTAALFVMSTVFFMLAYGFTKFNISEEFLVVARWCLWTVALITVGTLIAGFDAYYSVSHDAQSHKAMTDHRNWAIATSIVMLILVCWSWLRYRADKKIDVLFLFGMLIGLGLLMTTAWRGGELVYRHGIGVLSLPKSTDVGHQHEPSDNNAHQNHEHDKKHAH